MNAWKFFRGLLNRSKPFFNLLWYYVKCTEYFCSNFEFFTFASVKKNECSIYVIKNIIQLYQIFSFQNDHHYIFKNRSRIILGIVMKNLYYVGPLERLEMELNNAY